MGDTLAQLIVKLQDLLLGSSTVFSNATCTAAFRQALAKMNLRIPSHAADLIDAVSEQYEYEIPDITALTIVDVLLQGTDTYEDFNVSLPFDAYFEDDRPYFRLRTPQATGNTLIARYTIPYTIASLDSETVSTLPPIYDVVLLDGAAWQACLIRSAGRIETINMNINVSTNFERMAEVFRKSFEDGLSALEHRNFPVSEPTAQRWVDGWSAR